MSTFGEQYFVIVLGETGKPSLVRKSASGPYPAMSFSEAVAIGIHPVGGEISVKRGSESEIDRGNVAAKCNKQARQAPQRIAPGHCAGVSETDRYVGPRRLGGEQLSERWCDHGDKHRA